MIPTHQVASTGGYPPVRLSLLERAARRMMNPGVERGHRLGVLTGCTAQDQSTPKIH
jgi:hypothetical protein